MAGATAVQDPTERHQMAKHSAGIIPFRIAKGGVLEVFIVHPGGPYWAKKEYGAWSIAKGEVDEDQDPGNAAEREFEEEIGVKAPKGQRIDLGEIKQAGGKRVRAWAVESPSFEIQSIRSNEFDMEWPPRSGQRRSFPEIDRAEWCSAPEAKLRLVKAQREFVIRLIVLLGGKERMEHESSSE